MDHSSDRLFLLDAYALIFRAYYALIKVPRLTSSGFNTSAVFGFVNTLEEVLRRESPTHMAVCFDPPGPTFRHEAFEGYKAERAATPEDIKASVPIIKEILEAYRIPVVEVPGYEADDVIGTLSRRAQAKGYTTYMMSPDKDFGQLVTDRVLQYKPSYRGQDFELRGPAEVCARYGIDSPIQVIDLLALMGDKIDCIPGCPGVGEKTAEKLVREFGGVDALLNRTDELKGALKRRIEENADQIRFSRFLATIRTDIDIEIDPLSLRVSEPDRDALFRIFDRLEFRTLRTRVENRLKASQPAPSKGATQLLLFDTPEETPQPADGGAVAVPQYAVADSPESLDALMAEARGAAECSLVAATRGEADYSAPWEGTAIAFSSGRVWWIPAVEGPALATVLEIAAMPGLRKILPDAKRFSVLARRRGSADRPLVNHTDTSLAHYLIEPDGRHSLPDLAERLAGRSLAAMPPLRPARGEAPASAAQVADTAAAWAAEVLDVWPLLDSKVRELGLESLLYDMEIPLADVLADMELNGVRVDTDALAAVAARLEEQLGAVAEEIYAMAGTQFNIGSPARVGEILFDTLGLAAKAKKTKSGRYSTSEEVLESMADAHPIVGHILQWRKIRKLLSTYLLPLPGYASKEDGKIHTTFNQTVTATGRISSSEPNMQNIPVREELGREIRRAFIPDPGHVFLSADYSQIELRLAADMAADPVMTEAFAEGRDIHSITAARIFHKEPADVTADERRAAKTANFGILYGISAFGLAQRLGIPRAEAKALIDNYFATFPTISAYMTRAIEEARERGYATTIFGRRRMLPDITSRNPVVRGYAERNAINAPIQGTAADIIKTAMVRIDAEMRRRGMKSKIIMQVHDELNFDCPPAEAADMQELVARQMAGAYTGRVRMEASTGLGANWLEAH